MKNIIKKFGKTEFIYEIIREPFLLFVSNEFVNFSEYTWFFFKIFLQFRKSRGGHSIPEKLLKSNVRSCYKNIRNSWFLIQFKKNLNVKKILKKPLTHFKWKKILIIQNLSGLLWLCKINVFNIFNMHDFCLDFCYLVMYWHSDRIKLLVAQTQSKVDTIQWNKNHTKFHDIQYVKNIEFL